MSEGDDLLARASRAGEANGARAEWEALRAERDALQAERDRLRSILESSKVALGPGVAASDEELPECIEGRVKALERALARIRDRAIGELPELESPPDNRLLTIYVVAAVALDWVEAPAGRGGRGHTGAP